MKHATLTLLLALLAAAAAAQTSGSLGEAAERAKRERAASKEPKARVITNDDLARVGGVGAFAGTDETTTEAPAKGATTPSAPGAKTEKTDDQVRAEKQQEIQKKIDEQVRLMGVVRKAQADAQVELSDLSQVTFGGRRAALQKLVDDGNQELAKMQQAIDDLVEEARRQGISVSRP